MNVVLMILEILGVVAFAFSGALVAMKKEMDIFGGCILAMTTSIGGGIIRDLILGLNPPSAFINPTHALISIGVAIFTYLPFMQKYFAQKHKTYDVIFWIADSVGLGIFVTIGANTCYTVLVNPNLFTVIFLGTLTGVGGGVLRDIFSRDIPKIFVKNFYAIPCVLGSLVFFVVNVLFGILPATIVSGLLVITLRLIAIKFRWNLPQPKYYKTPNQND